jgi:hypothetical protein
MFDCRKVRIQAGQGQRGRHRTQRREFEPLFHYRFFPRTKGQFCKPATRGQLWLLGLKLTPGQDCQMVHLHTENTNFERRWIVQFWYTYFWPFGVFSGYLVYFMPIWYILWSFGTFFHVLVCCTKKNLATLPWGMNVLLTPPFSSLSGCVHNFLTARFLKHFLDPSIFSSSRSIFNVLMVLWQLVKCPLVKQCLVKNALW